MIVSKEKRNWGRQGLVWGEARRAVLGKGTRKCAIWRRQESALFEELKKARVAKTGTKQRGMR